MDILNFISWIKGRGLATTADRKKTLVPLGLKDDRRDDQYLPGAMTMENFEPVVNGYKEYTVLLTQTGATPPTAVELKNTLGVTVQYSYNAAGNYFAVFDQALFDNTNQYITITSGTLDPLSGDIIVAQAVPVFFFVLNIQSYINGLSADNALGVYQPTVLTIRKYN